jgi:hypothetical protein
MISQLRGPMIRLTFIILGILAQASCKTADKAPMASESESLLSQSELHCRIQLPGENHRSAIVAAKFPSNASRLAMVFIKRGENEGAQVIASSVSSDGTIVFEPNNQDKIAIKIDGSPRIASVFGSFNENQATPCVQLLTNSRAPSAKPPTCNALGTPAQGWYQSGKIIQPSARCDREVLFCGATPTPGWYIQKKTGRILAKAERCGWIRDTPVCKTGTTATGWHVSDRLIARDDECSYKHMECVGIGTKAEGWYVYERSSPKLLVAGACHSNRDIYYQSH